MNARERGVLAKINLEIGPIHTPYMGPKRDQSLRDWAEKVRRYDPLHSRVQVVERYWPEICAASGPTELNTVLAHPKPHRSRREAELVDEVTRCGRRGPHKTEPFDAWVDLMKRWASKKKKDIHSVLWEKAVGVRAAIARYEAINGDQPVVTAQQRPAPTPAPRDATMDSFLGLDPDGVYREPNQDEDGTINGRFL